MKYRLCWAGGGTPLNVNQTRLGQCCYFENKCLGIWLYRNRREKEKEKTGPAKLYNYKYKIEIFYKILTNLIQNTHSVF